MTAQHESNLVEVEVYQVAKKGNHHCGDSYFVKETDEYFLCVMADGLGSGEHAMKASSAITDVVSLYPHEDVEELMVKCNEATKNTRGAAVAILKFYKKTFQFVYSNIGNIRFYLYSPGGKLTYPLPIKGFLSGRAQRFRTQMFSFEPESRFLIHTDGLNLREIKSVFSKTTKIQQMSTELQSKIDSNSDDITYVIGHITG
ncbi:PP2C family serine/threonine-protein phosphatase [Metabacillus iocasae]|uniref:Negative regulator of sigma-B (Phosphoserine phosphatase) n=1 Tax=Priestia iocasae TaxID=2291674 RepID=A0ABS2QZW7_9BACI|nr:PP2C family serine/threonine-protein phosphatase [Metabacillus iocasae]MBM7705030.1 negative regulator of sigma-B (phosphoserine phosphatase) [Metabacillus iocasae]